jgi:hypothetical protein
MKASTCERLTALTTVAKQISKATQTTQTSKTAKTAKTAAHLAVASPIKAIGSGVSKSDSEKDEDEDEDEDRKEEKAFNDFKTSFPAKLLSIIQSMMHDHNDEDEEKVIDRAKAYVKEQLLVLGCPTYPGFDEEFEFIEEDMSDYCSVFRQLCYITSNHYDEGIDIEGYQIDLLEVDDVMLSQDTRALLEEDRRRQKPNFYGELEAGPYRGNAKESDGWMETRQKRESAARGKVIEYEEDLARRLPEYINLLFIQPRVAF